MTPNAMTLPPLISVIMPAFNAERYVAEAVHSVLGQSWLHWELIIVNDGSTDGTKAYLDTLTDPRIRLIHQANQGVSAARNAALGSASGEYITFLDADDVLPSGSLEVRARYLLAHPGIDIVDGQVSTRNENLDVELRRYRPYYQGKLLPRLLRLDDRVFFGIPYLIRKSSLAGVRFSTGVIHSEDLLFYMDAASQGGGEYGYVNELVYIYRKNAGSAMSNLHGLERGYLELISRVKSLPGVGRVDHTLLRFKVAKILFLSWWAAGEPLRSFAAAMRAAWA